MFDDKCLKIIFKKPSGTRTIPYYDHLIRMCIQTSAPWRAPHRQKSNWDRTDLNIMIRISKHSAEFINDDTIKSTCLYIKTPLKP